MIAKVIVDVRHENVDNVFDYLIPAELENIVQVGSRVLVEFGLRKLLGYIIEITNEAEYSGNLKPILETLDFAQNINLEQVKMAEYLYQTTNSFYISCLDVMLPSFLKAKYRKYLLVKSYQKLDADLATIIGPRKKVEIGPELIKLWPKVSHAIKAGDLEIHYGFSTYGKRRYTKFYTLADNYYMVERRGLTILRLDCLNYIENHGKKTLEEIVSNVGCSEYLVNDLVKKGFLKVVYELESEEQSQELIPKRKINYNFNQQEIIQKYQSLDQKPFLLFSSDDDFVLNFLIDASIEQINEGKKILILTPTIIMANEIGLLLRRKLKQARIATLTSSLKTNEFYEQYLNILAGNIDILITTKVGIFSPLDNIGLIFCLDEGNQNYVNEQNPRFHSHDILLWRAKYHQAKLIFASNAPSIKSYYQVYLSKYYLLKYLPKNDSSGFIINMKDEILNFGTKILSKTLVNAIDNVLKENKQALLILNRIAHSSLIRCESCQAIERCPHCDIALSYYERSNVYRCTYCNYQIPATKVCRSCQSKTLTLHGFGLEQLYNVVKEHFPSKKILLLDRNSLNQQFSDLIIEIEEGNVDIILGTKLVMGAFKNSKIELIGLIDPDSNLNYDHFQASERLFLDLYQCINRKNTKVYIQSFNPTHDVFRYAVMNDYDGFYQNELEKRKILNYEPYFEINRLLIIGEFKPMYHFANYFKKVFQRVIKAKKDILGPVYLPKHTGVQLIIKHQDYDAVLSIVRNVSEKFKNQNLNIIFEKYPTSFN